MDIINHALLPVTFTSRLKWYYRVVAGLLGALPDVIGWVGRLVNDNWEWYLIAHKSWWVHFVPFYNVHCWLDWFSHSEGKEWWVFGSFWFWVYILVWVTIIYLIYSEWRNEQKK